MLYNRVKYIARYIVFLLGMAFFSGLFSLSYYNSIDYLPLMFLWFSCACILGLCFSLFIKYLLLKLIKIKTTFLKVHEYFAWSYMLRYVVGAVLVFLVLEHKTIGKILNFIADATLLAYQVYIVKNRYNPTKKQSIIYLFADIILCCFI